MKKYTFHWEVETILKQFADALNDVIVKRYNESRAVGDQIHVNFVYAPKERVLHDLVNKSQHIKLPCIAMTQSGMKRNVNRVFNKITGSSFADTRNSVLSGWTNLLQPVPVDIDVTLSIITEFQKDLDQILTNFVPYTDPYIVVSWKWPYDIPWADFEIRSHILWNENVSVEYPVDISNNQPYRCVATTSFTIESWMFKNELPDGKPIYVIDHSFTSVKEMDDFNVMKNLETEFNTDYSTNYTVISAIPQFIMATPFITFVDNPTEYVLNGKMFDYTDSIYVSTTNWSIFDTTSSSPMSAGIQYIDNFSVSGFRLSAEYPGFSAIEIPESLWQVVNQSIMTIDLTAKDVGFFDFIALNGAGYSILSKDSVRETLNPYPVSSSNWFNYVEWQYPCISGMEVRSI